VIELLKMYRPDLEVGIVVEDRFADLYAGTASIIAPSIRELRAFAPELCLNLHGGTRSARLTALSGARIKAGFDIFRPSWVYTHRLPTAQQTLGVERRVHTAEHAASAVFALGVPLSEIPRARIAASPGRSPYAPARPYAVIHPLAAAPEKTWPAANFCQLAERLDATGLSPVFVGGPDEDLTLFKKWPTVAGARLHEVAQLSRDASLFVGNDSGPAHLAAAFGVPELVLFGPSDAEIWAPWRTGHKVIQRNPIGSITVEEALNAIPHMVMQ
jgi:ADP-heptose:LPS heptosyltransferase